MENKLKINFKVKDEPKKVDETRTTGELKGTLINKNKESESPLELKEGSVIEVVNLKVQTPVAPEDYTGRLTVLSIALKGSESGLKIKGMPRTILPDTYITFKKEGSDQTCTASLTKINENLAKK